jgi:hypothetical protein
VTDRAAGGVGEPSDDGLVGHDLFRMIYARLSGLEGKIVGTERRHHQRVNVSWPVMISTPQGLIEGEVKNISFGGALIQSRRLPDLHQPIPLNIDIPGHHYFLCPFVEVVGYDVLDQNNAATSYGLRVRFIDISEDDLRILGRTVLR